MCAPDMPEPPDPYDTAKAQTGSNISTAQANAIIGNVNQVTPYGSLTYTAGTPQFIEDANGQTYYRGPDGQITQSLPQSVATSTQQTNPADSLPERHPSLDFNDGGGTPWGGTTAQGSGTSGGGGGGLPEGYEKITGYYITPQTATQTLSEGEQAVYESGLEARQNLARLAASQSDFLTDYLGRPMDLSGAPAAGDPSKLSLPEYTRFASSPEFAAYADAPELATNFGNAGAINNDFRTSFGDAGDITRTYNTDFSEDRQRVEDALMERLQPYLDKKQESMRSQLLNSGIRQGSTAYSGAQTDFDRAENDARIANILAASQEQSRLVGLERDRAAFQNAAQQQDFQQQYNRAAFENQGLQFENDAQAQAFGQLLDRATFGNSARQQNFLNQFNVTQANNANAQQGWQNNFQATSGNNALSGQELQNQIQQLNAQNAARNQYLQEQFALRNQPINEISALLGTGQVQGPNFVNANTPTIPTTDIAGLINDNYNQRVAKANAEAQFGQNILGGLFGLGAAGIMRSDKRVKKDVKKIGRVGDQPVYEFRYKGEGKDRPKTVGLMAQNVERKNPDAVVEIGGVKHINMPKALAGLLAYGEAA